MTMARPVYKIDADHPGSEVAAETAAALAAAYLVFNTEDAQYADVLLQNAIELYNFADIYRLIIYGSINFVLMRYNNKATTNLINNLTASG